MQNLRFERISKIASHHAQIILEYFQALEKRIAKKWAKDEDFAKVSGGLVRICKQGSLKTLFYVSGCLVVWQKRAESYFFKSAKISSTVFFASPKHITVFSLKNSGFCTPA